MKYLVQLSIIVLLFYGCKEEQNAPIEKAAIYFNSVAADSSGIHFSNNLSHTDELNIIEYLYYYNGGGVAVGDINNDGLDDIYLTANQSSDKLYLNLGNLKFKDITSAAGINVDSTWSSGVTMEDINNDGLLDIYVSKVSGYKTLTGHNMLYLNQGDNHFVESAKDYGLDFSGLSTQASFFDYDNDGDTDVYLMNHSIHTPRSYGTIEKRKQHDSLAGDRLYENKLEEGVKKFEDVTNASGIYSSALGYGLALSTADINDDGLLDIYVGNDFHENDYLYINQGDKSFIESSTDFLTHTSRFTMGVDIADINNDLKADIFSLDMMPFDHEIFLKSAGEDSDKISRIKENYGYNTQYARNAFQLNRDNRSFSEIALMTNTYASDWSWSSLIQDFDNDGLNDIYVTNGIYKRPNDLNYINYISSVDFAKYDRTKQNGIEKELIATMPTVHIPNIIYRNEGNLNFSQLSETAGLKPSYSNGAAYSDFDNDGDLDIIVNNLNEQASLLENKSNAASKNNYIAFRVSGNASFANTNGTKIQVYAQDQTFVKQLNVNRGFQSASTRQLHFGLGPISQIDSIEIIWLDGKKQGLNALTLNQIHTIKRDSLLTEVASKANQNALEPKTFPFYHIENNFIDYDRETLMPEKLSAEGSAVVHQDFNGDGLRDIFIGGSKSQTPSLYIQQKNGSYQQDKNSGFARDLLYEDTDATAIDIDKDGDLDLYVTSGGNVQIEGNPNQEDRVYINNGDAKFIRLNTDLFRENGGSVSSGDFDGDGYDDLFIGNRSIPGAYGLSPFSYILKNTGKNGFSMVKKFRFGLVTDSQWADINGDDLLDLVVVGDWMPITIYINQGDSNFVNETKKYGLENSNGMWNSVLVTDIDQNGTNDIIGGNVGLNSKFKASKEKPLTLYLDDFDGNNNPDPIIFYDFFGNQVPFASRDKLIDQLPSLKKKFLDYEEFAKITTIESLTGKQEKDILEIKNVAELRSMLYLNKGETFESIPLPKKAQMSTIEDLHVDYSNDKVRLVFVGNYLDYTTELGKSSSNSGGVLQYTKKKGFSDFTYLPIPVALNARKLIRLDNGEFLVISSNDKSYVFNLPEQ